MKDSKNNIRGLAPIEVQVIFLPDEELPAPPPLKRGEEGEEHLTIRPMFISLEKFHELRRSLDHVEHTTKKMKRILEEIKINRDKGAEFLKEVTEKLEDMDENVEKMNDIITV